MLAMHSGAVCAAVRPQIQRPGCCPPQPRTTCRGPFLVLAPKAVLSNWTAEFEKWLGGSCEVLLYDGPADVRKQLVQTHVKPARFNVLLSHYHIAIADKGALSRVQVRTTSPFTARTARRSMHSALRAARVPEHHARRRAGEHPCSNTWSPGSVCMRVWAFLRACLQSAVAVCGAGLYLGVDCS